MHVMKYKRTMFGHITICETSFPNFGLSDLFNGNYFSNRIAFSSPGRCKPIVSFCEHHDVFADSPYVSAWVSVMIKVHYETTAARLSIDLYNV